MGSLISAAQLVIEEEGRERESFERREILFFRHAGNPVRKWGGRLGVSRSRAGRVPSPRSLAHASVYRGARLLRFRHLGLSRWVDGGSAGERARRSRRAESRAVSLGSQLDKITNGALDSDECRELKMNAARSAEFAAPRDARTNRAGFSRRGDAGIGSKIGRRAKIKGKSLAHSRRPRRRRHRLRHLWARPQISCSPARSCRELLAPWSTLLLRVC